MSLPRFIVQGNFAEAIILILLCIFILTNISFTKDIISRFFSICFSALFLTIADNLRFVSAHMNYPTPLRYYSAAAGYIIRPLIVFLLGTLIARRNKTKFKLWLAIPLIFNSIVALLSCLEPLHGLMFSYTDSNEFIRGTFGILPYIVSAFYVIVIFFIITLSKTKIKSEVILIITIAVLAWIATFMESIFKFDLILSQVLVIGTVFYYLFLNVQVYKRDILTKFENRRCFYLELAKLSKSRFILVSMDLNDLKLYNDTLGHAAGDRALIVCSEQMTESFPKNCKLYRTGGDEFMAICKGYSMPEVKEIVTKFQNDLSSTMYKVACGVAEYYPVDDLDKIISISDSSMYENKRILKQN